MRCGEKQLRVFGKSLNFADYDSPIPRAHAGIDNERCIAADHDGDVRKTDDRINMLGNARSRIFGKQSRRFLALGQPQRSQERDAKSQWIRRHTLYSTQTRSSQTCYPQNRSMKLLPLAALCCAAASAQTFPGAADLDAAINQAIREEKFPARCCWWVMRDKSSTARLTATARSCPSKEPMTVDTIFDIASLTKIVATTSGMMKLFEQGRIADRRPGDGVSAGIPGRAEPDHHPRSDDALLRPAPRSRSRAAMERLRNRHSPGLDR